jgi:ferredoxin
MREVRLPGAGRGEHLPAPNWKERKQLGERLEQGYRLTCQLWISHDVELAQDEEFPAPTTTPTASQPCM